MISFPAVIPATDMTEFDGEFSSLILYAKEWQDANGGKRKNVFRFKRKNTAAIEKRPNFPRFRIR